MTSCAAVLQYQLATNGRHGAPQSTFVKKAITPGAAADATELVIVSGPLDQAGAQASAVRLAERYSGARLRIAFCHRPSNDSRPAAHLPAALLAAFDAVFVDTVDDAALAAYRLVRAFTVPAESTRWIGCDWHGLCDLVTGARDQRAYHGFGSASRQDRGADAADAACDAALAQLEQQGGHLREAQGVSLALMTAGPDLAFKDSQLILARLRRVLHPEAAIFLSIGCDSALRPGTLDVSLLMFGAHEATGDAPAPQAAEQAYASNALLEQARALVVREGRTSLSLVQRHLHISYQQAASLIAALGHCLPATSIPDGPPPHLPTPTTTDREEIS